jgi:ribosomal protein L39E
MTYEKELLKKIETWKKVKLNNNINEIFNKLGYKACKNDYIREDQWINFETETMITYNIERNQWKLL